ncbi:MAG: hypothetical protein C4294_11770 [Nitrospiraceae bacterium]
MEKSRVLEVNKRFAEMFGYGESEVIGMAPDEFHPPEYRALVKEMPSQRRGTAYEAVCLRKDGSTFRAKICGRTLPYHCCHRRTRRGRCSGFPMPRGKL